MIQPSRAVFFVRGLPPARRGCWPTHGQRMWLGLRGALAVRAVTRGSRPRVVCAFKVCCIQYLGTSTPNCRRSTRERSPLGASPPLTWPLPGWGAAPASARRNRFSLFPCVLNPVRWTVTVAASWSMAARTSTPQPVVQPLSSPPPTHTGQTLTRRDWLNRTSNWRLSG